MYLIVESYQNARAVRKSCTAYKYCFWYTTTSFSSRNIPNFTRAFSFQFIIILNRGEFNDLDSKKQYCGSGSTCFWASLIRIQIQYEVWIRLRILLSPSKNSQKNLDSYRFSTSFRLFIFENYINVPSKNNKAKKIVFCWHLEGQ